MRQGGSLEKVALEGLGEGSHEVVSLLASCLGLTPQTLPLRSGQPRCLLI